MRFRSDEVAISADIQSMFYGFHVKEEHRNYLRFLWYQDYDPEKPLIDYRMTVHVFGNRPSPAVATYGLRKAVVAGQDDPNDDVTNFVFRNFYVDDGLTSCPTVEQAVRLLSATQTALANGGNLRLHKLSSNNPEVLKSFPSEDYAKNLKNLNFDKDNLPQQRSLGLVWDLQDDVFTFEVNRIENPFTRRGVLSTISSVFDPLGFAAPVIVQGKLLLRDLMTETINWDEPLSHNQEKEWDDWRRSLCDLEQLRVGRTYAPSPNDIAKKEVYVFSDASEKIIAAVAYLKTTDVSGNTHFGFIMGKNKVAPKHGNTIPRLELCAAVLAVQIAETVSEQLDIDVAEMKYFTDSRVVLGYLYNHTRRFYVYVANRVERIQKSSTCQQWKYVPSLINPADVATRDIAASDLASSSWLQGPSHLFESGADKVEPFPLSSPETDKEVRPEANVKTTNISSASLGTERFKHFSTWKGLVTAVVRLRHIIHSFKGKNDCEGWHVCDEGKTVQQKKQAETFVLQQVQSEAYAAEIQCLKSNKPLPRDSSILPLDPVLNADGLLVVGGRLRRSNLPVQEKTPIIVPGKHHVAVLLIRHHHGLVQHQGRLLTEGAIRTAGFWITGCKRLLTSIIYKCVTCRKLRGRPLQQKMSDLPSDRATPAPPFTYVGIDVFGSWNVVTRKTRGGSANSKRNVPSIERYETYLLLLLGFCGFSVLLAFLYNAIRKYIFRDTQNLDSTFDAGGHVTLSLTATTVATQLLWPADLLQSATVATKNGLAGPFWYSVGVVVNILLFPLLSVEFKTKAPGAKTYLQVIHARFGAVPHIVYSVFALVTNLVITSCLALAARATIKSLTVDASDEMIAIILAIMFGSYSFVGGLGTTFYVSYFNASLLFSMLVVLIVNVFYLDNDYGPALGTIQKMYKALNCTVGPDGNYGKSFLTFNSEGSLIFGAIGIFLASSVTFCDQASWQSRIAAKPTQGVLGFLAASFIWYAIPSTLATTTGMAYLAYSSEQGQYSLPPGQVDEGFVTPFIVSRLLGKAGAFMVLSMVSMALMSTGSGEVMAVSSILVYDIYQKYINPFRRNQRADHCILCGKKTSTAGDAAKTANEYWDGSCTCIRTDKCEPCRQDRSTKTFRTGYQCPSHGQYRHHQDLLIRYKDWCIVGASVMVIPYSLLIYTSGIDLNWAFTTGAVITIGFCPAVFLSIIWVKTTGLGITIGGIIGMISGVSVTLGVASTREGGLSNFLANTSHDYSVLGGCCTSFGVSLILAVVISLCTHNIKTSEQEDAEWRKTTGIRNPLQPWELSYVEDFPEIENGYLPSHRDMSTKFRTAKLVALVGSLGGLALLLIIIPAVMSTLGVMTESQFTIWVRFCHIWTFLMAGFAILAPPIQELVGIVRQYRKTKSKPANVSASDFAMDGLYVDTNM